MGILIAFKDAPIPYVPQKIYYLALFPQMISTLGNKRVVESGFQFELFPSSPLLDKIGSSVLVMVVLPFFLGEFEARRQGLCEGLLDGSPAELLFPGRPLALPACLNGCDVLHCPYFLVAFKSAETLLSLSLIKLLYFPHLDGIFPRDFLQVTRIDGYCAGPGVAGLLVGVGAEGDCFAGAGLGLFEGGREGAGLLGEEFSLPLPNICPFFGGEGDGLSRAAFVVLGV